MAEQQTLTSSEYISHHLTHLTYGKIQKQAVGPLRMTQRKPKRWDLIPSIWIRWVGPLV